MENVSLISFLIGIVGRNKFKEKLIQSILKSLILVISIIQKCRRISFKIVYTETHACSHFARWPTCPKTKIRKV